MPEVRHIAETWQAQRVPLAKEFSQAGLRKFVDAHEAMSRLLISEIGSHDPDCYDSLSEVARNAASILSRAKTFVNGTDVTPAR